MAESKQKYIERNRAPRVQIAYEVEHYGSPTTIELPFVMGVMAGLAGTSESDEAKQRPADRSFCEELNAGNFNAYMDSLAPRVKARVPNRLPAKDGETADEELFVDLTFRSMGDFSPDKVAEQVPALSELLGMRRQLMELPSHIDGKVDAEKRIAQLLSNQPLLAQVAQEALNSPKGSE